MTGWFAVKRGITSHPVFCGDMAKIGFFLWLMENAAFKDMQIDICGIPHQVKRGQLCHSQRFLAVKSGMSVKALRTFLAALESHGIVKVEGIQAGKAMETKRTQVTLCNYEKYQTPGNNRETTGKQPGNREEQRNKDTIPPSEEADASPQDFGILTKLAWDEGKRLLSRHGVKNPGAVIGRWMRDTAGNAQAILAAVDEAHKAQTQDPVPFITAILSPKPKRDEAADALARAMKRFAQ